MPTFRFTGDSERVFGDLGLTIAPGDRYDAKDNPDPNFFTEVVPRAKTEKATHKAAAPEPEPVVEAPAEEKK